MKTKFLLFFITFAYCQFSISQIINIPDTNFKNSLVSGNAVDTDGDSIGDTDADVNNDGEIDVNEASLVLGLKIDTRGINNLEGLQFFVNLRFLNCDYNNISSLDLSPFTNLEQLRCRSNNLTNLNLIQNTDLAYLDCNFNQLTSLTLGNLPDLFWLLASSNNLTSIDVSQLPNLNRLSLFFNDITSLDITNNPLLEVLFLNENQLTSLNTTLNPILIDLLVATNLLTELDISQNPLLEMLDCTFNQIDFLDASQNPEIVNLFCNDNNLEFLDFKNANNTSVNLFNASNNSNLTCIQVDDASYSQSQTTWTKDSGATYNETCPGLSTEEFSFNDLKIYPNPTSDLLNIQLEEPIEKVEIYNMLGQKVISICMTNREVIDLSKIQKGHYFLTIYNGSGDVQSKLITKK